MSHLATQKDILIISVSITKYVFASGEIIYIHKEIYIN